MSDSNDTFQVDEDGMGALASQSDRRTKLADVYKYRADGKLIQYQKAVDNDRDGDFDSRDPVLLKVSYHYDALGRRVAKETSRSCRRFKHSLNQSYGYLSSEDRILLARNGKQDPILYIDGNGIDEHLAEVSKKRPDRKLLPGHEIRFL